MKDIITYVLLSIIPTLYFGVPAFLILSITIGQRLDSLLSSSIKNKRVRAWVREGLLFVLSLIFGLLMTWIGSDSSGAGEPPGSKYQSRVYGW